jgi:hypothetical protein
VKLKWKRRDNCTTTLSSQTFLQLSTNVQNARTLKCNELMFTVHFKGSNGLSARSYRLLFYLSFLRTTVLCLRREGWRMENRGFEKWRTRGKLFMFNSGKRYCANKGVCSNKKIQSGKARKLYYVFCKSQVPCSYQSIYPKTFKIPIDRSTTLIA